MPDGQGIVQDVLREGGPFLVIGQLLALFAQDDLIHLLSAGVRLSDRDPFHLFERLMELDVAENVDPGHAFYLGFEMAKASLAILLGKQYDQDQPLKWGFLTPQDEHHRLKRVNKRQRGDP